jgi:hypothetical protein
MKFRFDRLEFLKLIKNGHCILLGRTQSGKSFFARSLLADTGSLIFLSKNTEYSLWKGRLASDRLELLESIKQGQSDGINTVVTVGTFQEAAEVLSKISFYLLSLGLQCTVFIDELADVATAHIIDGYTSKLWTKGLGMGINMIAACQRPTKLLNPTVKANTVYWVIFQVNVNDRDTNEIPFIDKVSELEKYEFLVTDGVDVKHYKPIGSGLNE